MTPRRKKRVKEPLTEDLLAQLLDAPDPRSFVERNHIAHRTLPQYLDELLLEKDLRRIDVVHAAGLNETFGYQIFVGQRNPSRDKVLQLAFAMRCTLREANRLLQAAGANQLYCKDRRDAIVIFALEKGYSLSEADEALFKFGEETIS